MAPSKLWRRPPEGAGVWVVHHMVLTAGLDVFCHGGPLILTAPPSRLLAVFPCSLRCACLWSYDFLETVSFLLPIM